MAIDKDAAITIIGGGAWGLSTAYHLARAGYTNITVFERGRQIPSPYSAANDLNKIVRAQYDTNFYTDLGLEAIEGWKTPDFAPYYHQTGHLVTVSGQAPQKAVKHHDEAFEYVTRHPILGAGVKPINTRAEFKEYAWQLTGPLNGFKGYFNRLEGYAHSSNALKGISTLLAGQGVRFLLGPDEGHVVELIYDAVSSEAGSSQRCSGVRTRSGKLHAAHVTICALGAYGASLVPRLGSFNVARCWSVVHIQLTESECDILRGLPIVNVRDLGFYFEPDPATRLLKLCHLGAGFSNTNPDTRISLPPLHDYDSSAQTYIPLEDEQQLRAMLRETLPWLANRPFVDTKLCWFSDTQDSEYCIDFVPGTEKSLVVLSGDSGHGFKMMPVFGKWVVDLLAKSEQSLARWQWKIVEAGTGGGGDWANDVSWRFGEAKELHQIIEERIRMIKARLS